jgi:hypothetical protein
MKCINVGSFGFLLADPIYVYPAFITFFVTVLSGQILLGHQP